MEKRMNGTLVSEVLYDELRAFLELKGDKPLQLVDISVGNDFGGEMYANMKKKKLEKMVGYLVESRHFDSISYDDLVSEIESINNDNKICLICSFFIFPTVYINYFLQSYPQKALP